MPTVTKDSGPRVAAIAVLLAACGGAMDVFSFFGLGKAFASIVTGNLVTAGYGVATGNVALIKPSFVAVGGFIAGAIAWAWLLRLRQSAVPTLLLLGELAILLAVLALWLAADARPGAELRLILLAAASAAMGGQSIWALRIRQTTTYFTGLVTMAISAASERSAGPVHIAVRQLAALLTGAIVSGVILSQLRLATPALPCMLLAAALLAHVVESRGRPPGKPQQTAGGQDVQ
jgi:uncharacterized membrane protein YoaK (UPF0700 family)